MMLTLFALIGYGLLVYSVINRSMFFSFYRGLIKKKEYGVLIEFGVFLFIIFLFSAFSSGSIWKAFGLILLLVLIIPLVYSWFVEIQRS